MVTLPRTVGYESRQHFRLRKLGSLCVSGTQGHLRALCQPSGETGRRSTSAQDCVASLYPATDSSSNGRRPVPHLALLKAARMRVGQTLCALRLQSTSVLQSGHDVGADRALWSSAAPRRARPTRCASPASRSSTACASPTSSRPTSDAPCRSVDNIVPVLAASVAKDPLVSQIVGAVSAAMTTEDLIALNAEVSIDR